MSTAVDSPITAIAAESVSDEYVAAAGRPLAAVTGAEILAPLISGGPVRYANLDYGASAPALTVVSAYLNEILPFYASVHRGAGYASQISTSVYENARNIVREFVGGRPDDSVIFTRNTTDSLNLLAGCLPGADGKSAGDVLYLDIEHHANLLPWQGVPHRSIVAADTIAGTIDSVRAELEQGGVSLLAVTGASNVTGEILPIRELAALAHRHGARIVVDAAQLAPHRRVDISADDVDYLAFSGHKLYAPFGAGVLVGRPDWLDAGTPHLAGGGAVKEARLDGVSWATGPARHEGGSPNVLGAATLARATQVIASLDQDRWHAHESAIRSYLVEGLQAIDGVTVHQIFKDTDPDRDTIGVVNFSVAGYDAGLVAAYLSAEHGVGLRDGRFCAHPLLKRLGLPSGSLRASFGVGSRLEDAQRLLAGIEKLRRDGLGWDYVVDAGRWVPANDTRTYPHWAPNTPGTAGAAPCIDD
ncbi:Cysteine desulfurase [Pseudarthrobacter chlorophenolicus A6]|uniref:Cysteine desulfurase n=1 Tax=Pseudarthrobacter chlorophenolicus (strain ATCC 700700 / DSM 12829 / CIP 107037 / JCM 12360 / KCTC 9906 / NCIMB 13794 / A6) TaxID=452863 RepID=B8HB40_PSECP|nr:aminotransferase class V-fold PLP-dependent enzyme [Pseudarthrobacter chlorophenolicus]ACL40354.1 Cysteine desulfurase [Pseudarthrobacter chlorophenolicus A6]SDQ83083.1 Selenocysteine lyase/Cysteine desulfurase [Pseudarthrobacter chlorophenolicus]